MEDVVTVLAVGERTLSELADDARREHGLAERAAVDMVEHAIRAGEALLKARLAWKGPGWQAWVSETLGMRQGTATTYIRMAHRADELRHAKVSTVHEAATYMRGMTGPVSPGGASLGMPEEIREDARRLRTEGLSCKKVGELLGVSETAVLAWTNPEYAARARAASTRRNAEISRLREEARRRDLKQVARKKGGARAELYAMAERMQDVMGQAHREATDPEERRAYALAGEHYRKMRDEIVRALGVS